MPSVAELACYQRNDLSMNRSRRSSLVLTTMSAAAAAPACEASVRVLLPGLCDRCVPNVCIRPHSTTPTPTSSRGSSPRRVRHTRARDFPKYSRGKLNDAPGHSRDDPREDVGGDGVGVGVVERGL